MCNNTTVTVVVVVVVLIVEGVVSPPRCPGVQRKQRVRIMLEQSDSTNQGRKLKGFGKSEPVLVSPPDPSKPSPSSSTFPASLFMFCTGTQKGPIGCHLRPRVAATTNVLLGFV